jgi:hypothetical protein
MDRFAFGSLVDFLASSRDPSSREPSVAGTMVEPLADPAGAAFQACAESLEELSRHISSPAQRAELLAGAHQLRARRS